MKPTPSSPRASSLYSCAKSGYLFLRQNYEFHVWVNVPSTTTVSILVIIQILVILQVLVIIYIPVILP